jgi:hypothetical protein
MFEAAQKIVEAISGLSESEVQRAILMSLIAVDKAGILIDPKEIAITCVRPPTSTED